MPLPLNGLALKVARKGRAAIPIIAFLVALILPTLLASRPFPAPPYLTAIYWRILKTTDPEVLPKGYLSVAFDLPSAGATLTIVSWRPLRETAAPPLKPVIWNLTVDNPTLKRTWGVTEPIQEELIYGHPRAWGGASGSPVLLNGKVVGVVVGITRDNHTLIEPVRKIQKALSALLAPKSH